MNSDNVETESIEDALMAKIITMVSLFSISMVVGCIPLLLSLKFDWFSNSGDLRSNRLVMGLLSFGGGVLFSTTFMHLLPEVDKNVIALQDSGDLPDMPIFFAGMIMCGGFFMMYLIEELVHLYIHSRELKTKHEGSLDIRKSISVCSEDRLSLSKPRLSHIVIEDDSVVSALRGLLIVLALSIHELFEGMAVGLESSVGNVWYMFAAVSAHKYIIAFCIGVEFLAARTKRWLSIVYIFTFSFVSALGIGIGILMVGGAGAIDAGLYSVVLQGITCGTLLYVVFFEIWRQSSGLMQYACALVGFAFMMTLEVIVDIAL